MAPTPTSKPTTAPLRVTLVIAPIPAPLPGLTTEETESWNCLYQFRNTINAIRDHLQPPGTRTVHLRTLIRLYYNHYMGGSRRRYTNDFSLGDRQERLQGYYQSLVYNVLAGIVLLFLSLVINPTVWIFLSTVPQDFLTLFLFRYARLVVNIIGFCLYKPAAVRHRPTLKPSDASIIVPTVEGEGEEFLECIRSVSINKPAKIIIVKRRSGASVRGPPVKPVAAAETTRAGAATSGEAGHSTAAFGATVRGTETKSQAGHEGAATRPAVVPENHMHQPAVLIADTATSNNQTPHPGDAIFKSPALTE